MKNFAWLIGVAYFVVAGLLFKCSDAQAADGAKPTFWENTILIYQNAAGELEMKNVEVPSFANEFAYVCFKVKASVPLHCMYFNQKEVIYREVSGKEVTV